MVGNKSEVLLRACISSLQLQVNMQLLEMSSCSYVKIIYKWTVTRTIFVLLFQDDLQNFLRVAYFKVVIVYT